VVALAVVLSVVVALLAVLVAGLLRSHADILRALHDLGVGVGEPAGSGEGRQGHGESHGSGTDSHGTDPVRVPLTMGPPLPGERSSTSAPPVLGVDPRGDALAVTVTGNDHLTLLSFLSSGCATCHAFWEAFRSSDQLGLSPRIRLVVVTKGPDMEIPSEVAAQAPRGVPVVMSTDAWGDYEVPGSPFFVLIDGASGRRIGEGVANRFEQVVELVRRAEADARVFSLGSTSRGYAGARVGQRPRVDGSGHHAGRPEPLPDVTRRDLRSCAGGGSTGGRRQLRRQEGGLTVATLRAHGIAAPLPTGFEGRIFIRPTVGQEVAYPVANFATFALPTEMGDFGGGAVNLMSSTDIFATLFEYGPESLGMPLFARQGMPRSLTPDDFRPYLLRRGLTGQSGTQWFFTESGRPFTLYVVLGSHSLRNQLIPRVNQLIGGLAVSSSVVPAAPSTRLTTAAGAPWN
jgi:hypothetical protein